MIKNRLLSYIKYLFFSSFALIMMTCEVWADRCKSVSEYQNSGSGANFILAGPFNIISRVASSVATFSWNSFAIPVQGLVVIGTAIYIALYVLKNTASFSKQDTLAFLTKEKGGIIPLCVKMAFIIALLNNQDFVYSTIIAPFITSSLLLGREFGGDVSSFSSASFGQASSVSALFSIVTEQAKALNDKIYILVAKGQFLFCIATNPEDGWGIFSWEWKLIPFALILFVIGWFIVIGTAFNILDILIRLAVGCIMLPLAIACNISKITSGYANKNLQLFLNCCFSFIIIGMLVLVANSIIDNVLSQNGNADNIFTIDHPSKNQVEDFADSMNGRFFALITLTVICSMIILNMFNDIENITSTIVGGDNSGSVGRMSAKIGAEATGKMKSAAQKPLDFAKHTAKEGMKMAGETDAGQAVKRGLHKFRTNVKKFLKVKN